MFEIAILLYLLWLSHLDTEAQLFFDFFLVPEAILCCRNVVVAKLKDCRVPSSVTLVYKVYVGQLRFATGCSNFFVLALHVEELSLKR